jgi:hypothetical protein
VYTLFAPYSPFYPFWYFSFYAWFISLNIRISSYIHIVPNDRISLFLWLNNNPLCICVAFSLFIYQLAIVNSVTMNIGV